MRTIQNQTFDEERALYGSDGIMVKDCSFDGPADGESAFKECRNVQVERSFFNLRYPFWHDHGLSIRNCEMTELCRAALWYSDHVTIENSKLYGIKALRECRNIAVRGCSIISPEFGWSSQDVRMEGCAVESEYFMMRSAGLQNFGSFVFASIAPIVTGCVVDTTHSFNLALVIAACVTFTGALCYFFIVKDRIE